MCQDGVINYLHKKEWLVSKYLLEKQGVEFLPLMIKKKSHVTLCISLCVSYKIIWLEKQRIIGMTKTRTEEVRHFVLFPQILLLIVSIKLSN